MNTLDTLTITSTLLLCCITQTGCGLSGKKKEHAKEETRAIAIISTGNGLKESHVEKVVLGEDGFVYFVTDQETVKIIDIYEEKIEIMPRELSTPHSLVITQDGDIVVGGSALFIIPNGNSDLMKTFRPADLSVKRFWDVSLDDNYLYVSSDDGILRTPIASMQDGVMDKFFKASNDAKYEVQTVTPLGNGEVYACFFYAIDNDVTQHPPVGIPLDGVAYSSDSGDNFAINESIDNKKVTETCDVIRGHDNKTYLLLEETLLVHDGEGDFSTISKSAKFGSLYVDQDSTKYVMTDEDIYKSDDGKNWEEIEVTHHGSNEKLYDILVHDDLQYIAAAGGLFVIPK